ncbi:MAG: polyphosphate--glucose phosphotransferase [Acidimicrobiia bacterium]
MVEIAQMIALGIDVGGSGVKGAPVDLATGEFVADRHRIKTPRPATPESVIDTIVAIVEHHRWDGPVGVALPAVVEDGVAQTAANIDDAWIGFDARSSISAALGTPVTVINDADAAGLAEARYGAAKGHPGVCLLLTFGTGIGSALIVDGVLVPNTELGHLEFRGMQAEQYAAGRLVERDNMDIDWWALRVNELLQHLDLVLSPHTVVFGGGISKRFEEYADVFDTHAEIIPARLRNNAGIVGAAIAAEAIAIEAIAPEDRIKT